MAKKTSKCIEISPENPQKKRIESAVDCIKKGGIIIYPTDTVYGIGCSIEQKSAIEAIKLLKGKKDHQPFSFICSSIQEASKYAHFDTDIFRVMKRVLPGPYTFLLEASKEAPRTIMSKRKKVGIRIPNHNVPLEIVKQLGHPIITTSVNKSGEEHLTDPKEINDKFGHGVALILECGVIDNGQSTIVEWNDEGLNVIREGLGEIDFLE
ncbi:MAG: threonylcarbamoyl-AMP synthase [Nitrospinae bacterium]|nr:threonylcarbamoyl-AMP synthase [Nitrospinota bacterium]